MITRELRNALFLIGLTIAYLVLELGFNARLLDLVGAVPASEQIEKIERFGRILSGVAGALFVFQWWLNKQWSVSLKWPLSLLRSKVVIVIILVATIIAVYCSIATFVDGMVERTDAQFRRDASNTTLLQKGLADNAVLLAGMSPEDKLFSTAEGKAFLAIFPFIALAIDDLDKKLAHIKKTTAEAAVAKRANGKNGYFKSYKDAIDEVRTQWLAYSRVPVPSAGDLASQQDKAWQDYLNELAKRDWTPQSVPARARGTVVKTVQRTGVPIPGNWHPADEFSFREAVAARYHTTMKRAHKSIKVGDQHVPPGLSYSAFVAHPAVQRKLRESLYLPANLRVEPAYNTPEAYENRLYQSFLNFNVHKELEKYEGPLEDYQVGGKREKNGEDSARALIVPPVALFFSLVGAIGHMGKLMYLLIKLGALFASSAGKERLTAKLKIAGRITPFLVIGGTLVAFWIMDNRVTTSAIYQDLTQKSLTQEEANWHAAFRKHALFASIHIISVGQGYGYPMNEWVRNNILQGFTYGYVPDAD